MQYNRQKILFLAHLLPWPLEGGGQIKSYHTLRILAQHYDVTLLAFIRRPEEANDRGPLDDLCQGGVRTILLKRGKLHNPVCALKALLTRQSFIVSKDENTEMRSAVQNLLASGDFAAIHVDHLQMMAFVPDTNTGTSVILDQHNIEHRIPKRIAETPGANPLVRWYAGQEWKKLRDFELAACARANLVLTVSDEDTAGFLELAPKLEGRIRTVPIGVDTDYFAVAKHQPSRALLSIGTMYWPPNVDSMLYFCREILPKVRERIPDVRLNIVGAKPTAEIIALGEADSAVNVTGSVPDVRPYADDCGVFVVPLRSGSGMRVKILNALSMGLPVVSTTVGAEGIEVEQEKHLLLADGADDFAAAVVRLLTDPKLATRLSENGRRLMETHYSWEAIAPRLLTIYEGVLHNKHARKAVA